MTPNTRLQLCIKAFVRTNFGLWGTIRLHRSAIGADLLRAPLNVFLAPVLLIVRLLALLAKRLGLAKTSLWLSRRKILLQTNVSRQIAQRVTDFIYGLERAGLGVRAPRDVIAHEVAEYTDVRNAVAEITTSLCLLIAGYIIFHRPTPGLFSLIGPVAERRAHSLAVEQFPFGQGLGSAYYAVFSPGLDTWQVVITGIALALVLSVVTTFAGLIADPLQVLTGTHRRRLSRLLERLNTDDAHSGGLAREHLTARLGDLSDLALNLWRFLRG
ncbi:MAG: DUF6635 family protein [Sulfitobacter sp.]